MEREKIIDAAAKLFEKKGYRSTTMKEIAAAVRVSQPALYYYFNNKIDILCELVLAWNTSASEALEHVMTLQLPASEKMRRILLAEAELAAEEATLLKIVSRERHQLPPGVRNLLKERELAILDGIQQVYDNGVREGVFANAPSRPMALALIGSCNSMMYWYNPRGTLRPQEIAEMFANLLLNGCMTIAASDRR